MQINEAHFDLVNSAANLAHSKTSVKDAEKAPAGDRMRRGKTLVIAGYAIMVLGIVLYCAVCLTAGVNQDLGTILLENLVPFASVTLMIIGAGTAIWLVGSILYLNGALDSAPDEEPKF